jgi:putative flippase GtrA
VRRPLFFLFAGGSGFVFYLCLSNLLHYVFLVRAVPAAFAATVLAIPPTFWMQRRLTFKSDGPVRRAFLRYIALQAANALVISMLTAVGTWIGLPGAVVFFGAGAASMAISYVVQSQYIFGQR